MELSCWIIPSIKYKMAILEDCPENIDFIKSSGNKTKQLHTMSICLKNNVVTKDARNVLLELPNT